MVTPKLIRNKGEYTVELGGVIYKPFEEFDRSYKIVEGTRFDCRTVHKRIIASSPKNAAEYFITNVMGYSQYEVVKA